MKKYSKYSILIGALLIAASLLLRSYSDLSDIWIGLMFGIGTLICSLSLFGAKRKVC